MDEKLLQQNRERRENLERQLFELTGCLIEITMRGSERFTLSTDGNRVYNFYPVIKFLGPQVIWESIEYDKEADLTVGYFTLNI